MRRTVPLRPSPAPSRSRSLPAGALALLLLSLPAPLAADYKDRYEEALQASRNGDWAAAVPLLEAAIAEEPREALRVRAYGMRFFDYLPHYHLGVARFRLGDCEGALAAWRQSESQGVIQGTDEFRTLVANRTTCQERARAEPVPPPDRPPEPPRPDPALTRALERAESAITEAEREAAGLDALRADPLLAPEWRREPALGPAEEAALERLEGARGGLDAARDSADAEAAAAAAEQARSAREDLRGIGRAAADRRDRLAAAQEESEREAEREARRRAARQALAEPIRDGRAALDAVREARLPSARVPASAGTLEALLAEAGRPDPTVERLEELPAALKRTTELLRRELSAAVAARDRETQAKVAGGDQAPPAEPRKTPDRAPPAAERTALRTAVDAYLGGRYDETVELLTGAPFGDRRLGAHAALLRAAARFALHRLGGGEDADLIEAARADVRGCRDLDRSLAPAADAFSPLFRTFFAEVR